MLRPFGHAVGFDLTRIGTEFAKAHGHAVAQASLSDMPFSAATFDLVTSFDVLQVVPDDVEQAGIAEMARVASLAAGCCCTWPRSISCTVGTRCCPMNIGDIPQLRYSVESAGFRIERLTYDHLSLLPMMLPVRVWHRLIADDGRVVAGEAEITVSPAPVNAALTALVSLEAQALRIVNMPIGCSLMCLARKPS